VRQTLLQFGADLLRNNVLLLCPDLLRNDLLQSGRGLLPREHLQEEETVRKFLSVLTHAWAPYGSEGHAPHAGRQRLCLKAESIYRP